MHDYNTGEESLLAEGYFYLGITVKQFLGCFSPSQVNLMGPLIMNKSIQLLSGSSKNERNVLTNILTF